MSNPLLESHFLPPFKQIKPAHVVPAIDELITASRDNLETTLKQNSAPTWDSLVEPLTEMADQLSNAWSPVGHLNAVSNNEDLRKAYNESIVKLSEWGTEFSQNEGLYKAYEALADSPEFLSLSVAQKKMISNALRDFKLSGVGLPAEKKKRFGEISKRLTELSSQISNNVMDATQGWFKHVDSVDDLAGLPDTAIAMAQQNAEAKSLPGYVVTLDIPMYIATITHADNRALREEIYRAYATRASKNGVAAGDIDASKWDNSELIDETLVLRHEMANLLGFANYAELSLATKMAESTEQVVEFLRDLASKTKKMAAVEYEEVKYFAKQRDGIEPLEAWDLPYYSEKLKEQKYNISQEQLRPYFPAEKVLDGMFTVANKLFGIEIERVNDIETWHKDVRFYAIKKHDEIIAYFYFDIFARENKRGGAWMDSCRVKRKLSDSVQKPVAYLVCNFNQPTKEKPSLLTHNEVTTLFHEFGHGLHHMLTKIDVAEVSGINGVAWDAVELPSQFMENWCWEKEVIPLISAHYKTGETLPVELLDKMLAAKNYQSGMFMLRQLEFSLFDFLLHKDFNKDSPVPVQNVLDKVRNEVAVAIPPAFNKFQNSFTHIFAGGYAAGYYSYKWAEVLSADAFSLFEEKGIFDKATGEKFLTEILEAGGSEEPMALYERFRGRKPNVDALLRHSGIVTE